MSFNQLGEELAETLIHLPLKIWMELMWIHAKSYSLLLLETSDQISLQAVSEDP